MPKKTKKHANVASNPTKSAKRYYYATFIEDGIRRPVATDDLNSLTQSGNKHFVTVDGQLKEIMPSYTITNKKYVDSWGNNIPSELYAYVVKENKAEQAGDTNKAFKYIKVGDTKIPVFSYITYFNVRHLKTFDIKGQPISKEISSLPFYVEYYWTGLPNSKQGRININGYYMYQETYYPVFSKVKSPCHMKKLHPSTDNSLVEIRPAIETEGSIDKLIDKLLADIDKTYPNTTHSLQTQFRVHQHNKRKHEADENTQIKTPSTVQETLPVKKQKTELMEQRKRDAGENTRIETPSTEQQPHPVQYQNTEPMEQQRPSVVNHPSSFFYSPMPQNRWKYIVNMPSEDFNDCCKAFNFKPYFNPFK